MEMFPPPPPLFFFLLHAWSKLMIRTAWQMWCTCKHTVTFPKYFRECYFDVNFCFYGHHSSIGRLIWTCHIKMEKIECNLKLLKQWYIYLFVFLLQFFSRSSRWHFFFVLTTTPWITLGWQTDWLKVTQTASWLSFEMVFLILVHLLPATGSHISYLSSEHDQLVFCLVFVVHPALKLSLFLRKIITWPVFYFPGIQIHWLLQSKKNVPGHLWCSW